MRDILKAVPFFQDLTGEEMDRVLAVGRVVPYAKDMLLFKESDPGEALYIVLEGSVRISKLVPGLGEQIIAFVEQGSFFGEMALFDEYPRSATAMAQEDCKVLFFDRTAFLQLLQNDALIARKVLRAFCRTL